MEKKLRAKLEGGGFKDVPPEHSKRMGAIRGRGNRTTERRFRLMLVRAGLRGWQVNPHGLIGKPDVYFPAQHVAVFLDGCFWHGCLECGHVPQKNNAFWMAKIERNRERDTETTHKLEAAGTQVLRLWEHDLVRDRAACMLRLKSMIINNQQ